MKTRWKTRFLAAGALLLALVAPPLPAQTRATHDYSGMKMQMQLFETVLSTALKQRFGHPFSILQPAKGVYLEGFGVVFSVEANLYPMRFISPFSPAPYSEKELKEAREQKPLRMKKAEEMVEELLRDHGPGLSFLRPDENVAVAIHVFNPGELSDLPSQVVIQTKRQTLIDAAGQKLTAAEFRNKLSVVTF